jgi:hypothetical protein
MAVKFSDGGKGFFGRAPRPTPEQMQARKRDAAAAKATQLRKQQTRQKNRAGGAHWWQWLKPVILKRSGSGIGSWRR